MKDYHFFPTPPNFARAIVNLVQIPPTTILDPGAGAGIFGQMCRERWQDAFITGVELRDANPSPYYNHWITGNFKAYASPIKHDLIIGNPPFKYAEDFIRVGWLNLAPAGEMIYLLRLNMISGWWRTIGLWRDIPPTIVHIFPTRPSFLQDGVTDIKTEYAAFHWTKGRTGDPVIRWVKDYK